MKSKMNWKKKLITSLVRQGVAQEKIKAAFKALVLSTKEVKPLVRSDYNQIYKRLKRDRLVTLKVGKTGKVYFVKTTRVTLAEKRGGYKGRRGQES